MRIVYVFVLVFACALCSNAQSDRDRGIELFRVGDYAGAIDILEKLSANGEADYPTTVYLGAAYVKMGKNDLAIKAFDKAGPYSAAEDASLDFEKKIAIKKAPKPKFDKSVQMAEKSGRIRLAVEFRQNGSVGFVFPFSTTSEKIIQAAINAASAIRFEPAIKEGKPVPVVMIIEYAFEIKSLL